MILNLVRRFNPQHRIIEATIILILVIFFLRFFRGFLKAGNRASVANGMTGAATHKPLTNHECYGRRVRSTDRLSVVFTVHFTYKKHDALFIVHVLRFSSILKL